MKKKNIILFLAILTIFILTFTQTITPAISTKIDQNKKNTPTVKKESNYKTTQKITDIIKKINKTIIEKFLKELISIGPRLTGSYGCEKAGEYIYNKFKEFNLEADKHEWAAFGNWAHKKYYRGENIEGTLLGNNQDKKDLILFNAHYDTVRNTVGANDDGSGVVAVLTAAYVLSQYSFNKSIRFVTFSGEEIGLRGSGKYVKKIYEEEYDLLVEFNADMIGYAEKKEDERKIRLSYTEDTEWIIDIIEQINNTNNDLNIRITKKYKMDRDRKEGGSDYFPFVKYGYESIAFWEAVWDPNMHTPEDDFDNVNLDYLVNTTRIIAATIAAIADEYDIPPRLEISTPRKGVFYYEDRIFKTLIGDTTISIGDIWIYTDIKTVSSPIEKVEFYCDGKLEYTAEKSPFVWKFDKIAILKKFKITAIAYDEQGRNSTDQVSLFFINPSNPY